VKPTTQLKSATKIETYNTKLKPTTQLKSATQNETYNTIEICNTN
jgi:hypothetical protein